MIEGPPQNEGRPTSQDVAESQTVLSLPALDALRHAEEVAAKAKPDSSMQGITEAARGEG